MAADRVKIHLATQRETDVFRSWRKMNTIIKFFQKHVAHVAPFLLLFANMLQLDMTKANFCDFRLEFLSPQKKKLKVPRKIRKR